MNLKRVVFVTSFYPFFGKEVWLKDELAAMGVSGCRPVIIPRRYEQEPERYKINADHEVLNVKMISISIILNTILSASDLLSFWGSGIFKSSDPSKRAEAIVEATTFYDDPIKIAKISSGLKDAMKGLDIMDIPEKELLQNRGW